MKYRAMGDNWGRSDDESTKMSRNPSLLCKLSDIPDTGKEVRVETGDGVQWLMIFLRSGEVSAWRNACPHQGRALNWAPGKFLFSEAGLLVCAHHGACFDLSDGRCTNGPCEGARLTRIEVEVDGDKVYLRK